MVGGEARSCGRASTNFGREVWPSTSYQVCEHAPQVFFKRQAPKRGRVLQDRFQQGATPLCLSTYNSTHVLTENQEVRRDSVRSYRHLLAHPGMRFPFIAEHSQQYPVTLLCQALDVSVSGYYAWRDRPVSQHCREDAQLAAEIQQIFLEHRQVYGSPRIHAVLKARGMPCSRKRVVRLMQQLGLSAQTKRSRKPTTKSDRRARFAPNRLNREFSAQEPNSKWVIDTKAVETAEGWLYLAVILDLFSRLVVGWAMAATEDEQLVELALRMAVVKRHPPAGLLYHSDRGSEFTSDRYLALLAELGIEVSMSRTANCYDNAAMESFFASLTKECTDRTRFKTRQQARSAIFEYLECFYNPVRLHSTLQYVSPVAFEHATTSPMS
jgi:putative transposase